MKHGISEKVANIVRIGLAYLVQAIGLLNFLTAFPIHRFSFPYLNSNYFPLIKVNHILTSLLGLLLLLFGIQLRKRMRLAWYIAMISLPILMMLTLTRSHVTTPYLILLEGFVYISLLINHSHYSRHSQPFGIKMSLLMILCSFGLLLTVTTLRILILKDQWLSVHDWASALSKSFSLLFLMDTSVLTTTNRFAILLIDSTIALQWAMILISLFLLFTPLIVTPIMSAFDHQKVREYLMRFSSNPIDYVIVEKDKHYFFAKEVEGVIGYVLAVNTAVVAGEPVCAKESALQLLIEFKRFCHDNFLDILMVQTSDRLLDEYRQLHFGIAKYGEEAMFELSTYSMVGNKAQKVRYAYNRATRDGVVVHEYQPQVKRDSKIEADIKYVSKQWLKTKKSSELSFTLGSIGLEEPLDKRYFLAYDAKETCVGFIVFTPFANRSGYHADVTRRLDTAPQGSMEKIILSAFEKMKNEGVKWGSLGLAPLANITEDHSKMNTTERLLDLVYENMNTFYGFKSLYHYKKGYNPSHWITRYLIYSPAVFSVKTAYALLKAQNPKGVSDYLLAQLKLRTNREESE